MTELLAEVTYLKHFRHFVLGREFVLRTDHAAHQSIHRTPEPIGQQARWLSILEEFQPYTVQHRPGRVHGNADTLSRHPIPEQSGEISACAIQLNHPEPSSQWSTEELKQATDCDPVISEVRELIDASTRGVDVQDVIAAATK